MNEMLKQKRYIKKPNSQNQFIKKLYHTITCGILVCSLEKGNKILEANNAAIHMFGFTEKEFWKESRFFNKFLHPDYVEEINAKVLDNTDAPLETVFNLNYPIISAKNEIVWIHDQSQIIQNEKGENVFLCVLTDVTEQKNIEEKLKKTTVRLNSLISNIPGGIAIMETDGYTSKLIYLSEGIDRMLGYDIGEALKYNQGEKLMTFVHPDDVSILTEKLMNATKNKLPFSASYRVKHKNGNYNWVLFQANLVEQTAEKTVYYGSYSDINEFKLLEEALRESEEKYIIAAQNADIQIWEYDIENKKILQLKQDNIVPGIDLSVEQSPEDLVKLNAIREDCIPGFLEMFKRIELGEKKTVRDIWIRTDEASEYYCARFTSTVLFDENNKPIRAFGSSKNITKEKEAEKRYYDELAYREAMRSLMVASINANLTQNLILEGDSKYPSIARKMKNLSFDEYIKTICNNMFEFGQREIFKEKFSRESLLKSFNRGNVSVSMDFLRMIEKKRCWVTMTVHMLKKPESTDIIAFVYSTDITNEKVMQNIMDTVIKTDYDFLVVFDLVSNSAVRYSENEASIPYAQTSENFEKETQDYIRKLVNANEVEGFSTEYTLENIINQLENKEVFNIFYSITENDGKVYKKQLRFNYMDRENKIVLMTRIDITGIFEEQEQKNRQLEEALTFAEHANRVKLEFLAKMSHEIRTPMNAIMGTAEIALQNSDDKAFVVDCIVKSQLASKYLLSLINDILDMSKIESGKVTLVKEKIDFFTLIQTINTIILPQANVNNVQYQTAEDASCQPYYIGDTLRIQQIMINILSNAVKFTQPNGKVSFSFYQVAQDNDIAILKFVIEDTGIGISKEYMSDIFSPFSQEHNGTTTNYGGSGLGLAISKNLATLMGGDISVESTLGEGSKFTVILPLTIHNQQSFNILDTKETITNTHFDFKGIRVLLIEDHPLNIMIATKLLESKNIKVDIAKNGKIGVELFTKSSEGFYNAILMDIRMPVMDGIQATKAIRKLDNTDAKTIPIIAMTANASKEDIKNSKRAGMIAHLSKPIESQLLFHVLQQTMETGEKNN